MTADLRPPVWTPSADPDAVEAVAARLADAGFTVERDRSLAAFTTFGIGGPARLYAEPADDAALQTVLRALAGTTAAEVPLLVVGRGSNMLVADSGFPGLALRLGKGFNRITREGTLVEAGAGVAMPQLASWTAKQALAGLEFAAAIPASVGGSVRMNAGAHGGEVATHLDSADVRLPGSGELRRLGAEQLGLGYRRSDLPERSVVVTARWRLAEDEPEAIRTRLEEHRAWRRRTQPLRARSCGSTFTNPPGASAGRLIESAGMKGFRIGGAQVSDKHANFIVVEPGTRAADVLAVIAAVRRAVLEAGGPQLHPEVRAVGDFGAGLAS